LVENQCAKYSDDLFVFERRSETMKVFAVCMLLFYLCLGAVAAYFGFAARHTSNTRVSNMFPYILSMHFILLLHNWSSEAC
jgi:hypothetical protein